MRKSDVVLLWIGGGWFALIVVLCGFFDQRPWAVNCYVEAFKISVPIWIVCALIWVTLYWRRKRVRAAARFLRNESKKDDDKLIEDLEKEAKSRGLEK